MAMNPSSGHAESVNRILIAAEELFSEHGFDAVSMNAIAARAGVSKANVFHHFTSKNDLYLAVIRGVVQENAQRRLDELVSSNDSLADRLAQFATGHLASVLKHERVSRLIQRELLNDGPRRGQELAEQVFGDNFRCFVNTLREGQKQGILRSEIDPAMVAIMMIAADIFFFEGRHIFKHFPDVTFADDPELYSRMLIDILLRGTLASTAKEADPDAFATFE